MRPLALLFPPHNQSYSSNFDHQNLARISNHALQSVMPPHNTLRQTYEGARSPERLLDTLKEVLHAQPSVRLEEFGIGSPSAGNMRVSAWGNTWSRAARRKRKARAESNALRTEETEMQKQEELERPPLIECVAHAGRTESGTCFLECRWVRGKDRALFESLWSHLSRKVASY